MKKSMKILMIVLIIALMITTAVLLVLSHPAFGLWTVSKERKARIEASANYLDGMFRNQEPTPQFTGDKNMFRALWEFVFDSNKDCVPTEAIPAVKTDLKSLDINQDLLLWFGHSSYMFQVGGKRFLVDPVLDLRFPSSLMMKPFKGTDIYSADDLPEIDYLIITHEHWDHLDYGTLRKLKNKVKTVICSLGVGEYLEYWGYKNIVEMDWYEQAQLDGGTNIFCLPTRHFSNRLIRRNQTLWASFLIEREGRKVYIGGDGGYDNRFKEIHEHYGVIDLAFLENGQYNEDWAKVHTMPQELSQAVMDLGAKSVFTVHHNKFALAKHAWYEPQEVAARIGTGVLDAPIGTPINY